MKNDPLVNDASSWRYNYFMRNNVRSDTSLQEIQKQPCAFDHGPQMD